LSSPGQDNCRRLLTPSLTVEPKELLKSLDADIDTLEAKLIASPSASYDMALDFSLGGKLMRLVMCAIKMGFSLDALIRLARTKLDLLEVKQLVLVWTLLQREFDPERDARLEKVNSILPNDFLKYDDEASSRNKLAEYVVSIKPRLMLALQGRGISGYPVEVPELARILTWKSTAAADRPSMADVRLATALRRVTWLSNKLFDRAPEDIIAVLNVDGSSLLIQTPTNVSSRITPSLSLLFYELRKICRLLQSRSPAESDIAFCVRRYKLGLEIMAPDVISDIKKKDELRLQKDLARFLIERGFFVVGTKSGRSESDLISWEGPRLHILEVKLLRPHSSITPAVIEHAFAQLASYMDQHPSTPYGLLVIYNLTDIQINAPDRWMRDRYLVVAINLQARSPSGRQAALDIIEGKTDKSVEVLSIGDPRGTRSRRRKPVRHK
jgi:hypothetical protein